VADVAGFEESIRYRIVLAVSQGWREIQKDVLEDWLNLKGRDFDNLVKNVAGFTVDGDTVQIPLNKENEAKGTMIRENVKLDRKSDGLYILQTNSLEFSRVLRRAYEQPA
jgi:translation initiation factor 3 subunit K